MAAYTHWRLLIYDQVVYGPLTVSQWQFYNASAVEIPATGGTASASDSTYNPASNVFDGNINTWWGSGVLPTPAAPQWLQYQFPAPVDVASFSFAVRNDGSWIQGPASVGLQGSNNGTTWTLLGMYSAMVTASGQSFTFQVGTGLGDFYRLRITSNDEASLVYSIAELVFMDGAGAVLSLTNGAALASNTSNAVTAPPSYAFDGSTTAFWASTATADPQWLGFRFNGAATVVKFSIRARGDGSFPQTPHTFILEKSVDGGSTWAAMGSYVAATWTIGMVQTFTSNAFTDLGALQVGGSDLGALQVAPAPPPLVNIRVTQEAREALQSSSGAQKLRVTQAALEAIQSSSGVQKLRVTQVVREALQQIPPPSLLRVTQAALEALQSSSGVQKLRVTHVAREILEKLSPPSSFARVTQVARECLELIPYVVPEPPGCNKVVRGTISPEQVQGALRQGDSPMVLMAQQSYDFTPGYVLVTDECGNAVDTIGGLDAIPFQLNSGELCRVFPGGEPEPPLPVAPFYDIVSFFPGKPNPCEMVMSFVVTRPVLLSENWGGVCVVGTPPSVSVRYKLQIDLGTSGYMDIATDGTAAFSIFNPSNLNLTPGTVLSIEAPDWQDPALSDVGITFSGVPLDEVTDMPYDVPVSYTGKPQSGERIFATTFVRDVTAPPNFSGSLGYAWYRPLANAVFSVKQGGTQIGTVTFTPAGAVNFATTGGVAVEMNTIEIFAPTPADDTLENFAFTFMGIL